MQGDLGLPGIVAALLPESRQKLWKLPYADMAQRQPASGCLFLVARSCARCGGGRAGSEKSAQKVVWPGADTGSDAAKSML